VAPVDEGDKWLSSIQASESAGEPMAHVFSRVVDDLWSDEHLAIVETLLQRLPPPGRVLQIGGSTTALCELMEAAGYSTVFLQSNPWFALNAAHQLGIEVRHGHLQDQDFESGSFDAMVILGRTLCRFERPVEFLAAARRLLSDQGLLLVSERFPNLEGSYSEMRARGAEALMWLKPFGNRFAFSKDGLERLINAAGFSTVEMARWKQSYPPWADLLTEWDLVTAADGPTSAVAGTDQAVPETARGRLLAALVEARGEIRTLLERREEDRALAFEQLSRVSWSRVGAGTSGDLVEFGSGWYGPELFGGESFRWGSSPARLSVVATAETAHRLTVRLEPGPGVGGDEMELHLCTLEGEKLASRTVRGRETVSFELPTAARRTTHLQLIAPAGGGRIESDPRILDFRLFDLTLD
jgi:SAM-dependent methyltransferase